jgi:hypothetical protein
MDEITGWFWFYIFYPTIRSSGPSSGRLKIYKAAPVSEPKPPVKKKEKREIRIKVEFSQGT